MLRFACQLTPSQSERLNVISSDAVAHTRVVLKLVLWETVNTKLNLKQQNNESLFQSCMYPAAVRQGQTQKLLLFDW